MLVTQGQKNDEEMNIINTNTRRDTTGTDITPKENNNTSTSGSHWRTVEENKQSVYKNNQISKKSKHTLVTDLVPSEMACLASSPGRIKRTEVWISLDEMVDFLE